LDNGWPHVEEQSTYSSEAQSKGNGHAGAQENKQCGNDGHSGPGGTHAYSPGEQSFRISTRYWRLSRMNPNTIGASGIHNEMASMVGVVHPPSQAAYQYIPLATAMITQNASPSTEAVSFNRRSALSRNSSSTTSTPTWPRVSNTYGAPIKIAAVAEN